GVRAGRPRLTFLPVNRPVTGAVPQVPGPAPGEVILSPGRDRRLIRSGEYPETGVIRRKAASARLWPADPRRKEVPEAHHAADRTAVPDREVAEPILDHDLRRFFYGSVRARRLPILTHPVPH